MATIMIGMILPDASGLRPKASTAFAPIRPTPIPGPRPPSAAIIPPVIVIVMYHSPPFATCEPLLTLCWVMRCRKDCHKCHCQKSKNCCLDHPNEHFICHDWYRSNKRQC